MKSDRMDIGYIFDDGYVECATVSMYSLMTNNKDVNEIIFYIFDGGISTKNKKHIQAVVEKYKRKVKFLDVCIIEGMLKDMNVEPWRKSYTAYIKLLVCEYLPKEVERFLVIDGDTIIDGSLRELFDMSLDGCSCAMGLEGIYSKYKLYSRIGNGYHYNTGVIVYDVEKWKKEGVENKLINHLKNVFCAYMLPEEDPISIILPHDVKILNPKYNFLVQYKIYSTEKYFKRFGWDRDDKFYELQELIDAGKDVKIYHCIDTFTNRPWEYNNCHPYTRLYDNYYDEIKRGPKKKRKLSFIESIEYIMRKKMPYNMSIFFYYIAARLVYGFKAKLYYKGKL